MDVSVSASSASAPVRDLTAGYRPEIDSLRAIAVIAVLLSHWLPWFPRPINWGIGGVYLFFAISGYVITRGLLQEKDRSGSIDFRQFFMRRIVRIWPAYYMCIAVSYFVWPGFPDGTVIWHLTFLSNVLFSQKAQFPAHFWSLSVEQQFYLAWPFLALLSRKRLAWVCVAMLVIAPLSRALLIDQHPLSSYYATNSNLDCLAAGALAAIFERCRTVIPAIVGLVSAALLASVCVANATGHYIWCWGMMGTAFAGLSFSLILLFDRLPMLAKAISPEPLLYIGKISYGIYLYHMIVGLYLFDVLVPIKGPEVFAAVAFCVTVVVASISWYCFERPIKSLITTLARKSSTNSRSLELRV